MNNIPKESGFIDSKIFYPLSNIFVPIFYNLGFTPNLVTTLTLILRITALYNLYYKKNYTLIIILYTISIITDNIDGQLARNYNMTSKFGSYYDLIVDILSVFSFVIIYYVIYYKENIKSLVIYLTILSIFQLIKLIKLSCDRNKKLKLYQKEINKYNVRLPKNVCEKYNFIQYFDEGLHYLTRLIFLVYTLYFYKPT